MLKQTTTFLTAVAIASTASAGISCFNISDATGFHGPVSGNDKPTAAENLLDDEAFGGSDVFGVDLDWSFAGSSDGGGNGPFTGNPQTNSGTLNFDSPQSGPFAITLKSANYFSIYYFDATHGDVDCIYFDTFDTSGKNGKGRDLSHASLFTAEGTPPTGIPSPTAALAGLGLLGLIASRRRRG